jgi:hypothetical protein
MRIIISLLAGFVFAVQALAQATVVYSYDSAGNRTQRDTTSTYVAMLSTVDWNVVLEASQNMAPLATSGEVVISGGISSPKPIARHSLLEKFGPIITQPLQIITKFALPFERRTEMHDAKIE